MTNPPSFNEITNKKPTLNLGIKLQAFSAALLLSVTLILTVMWGWGLFLKWFYKEQNTPIPVIINGDSPGSGLETSGEAD